MPPRNPSELQRLEEERQDILDILKSGKFPYRVAVDYPTVVLDKGTKSIKEALLRELRTIEATLGIESVPYNSTEFGKQK
jgi:hypothetical protein